MDLLEKRMRASWIPTQTPCSGSCIPTAHHLVALVGCIKSVLNLSVAFTSGVLHELKDRGSTVRCLLLLVVARNSRVNSCSVVIGGKTQL